MFTGGNTLVLPVFFFLLLVVPFTLQRITLFDHSFQVYGECLFIADRGGTLNSLCEKSDNVCNLPAERSRSMFFINNKTIVKMYKSRSGHSRTL